VRTILMRPHDSRAAPRLSYERYRIAAPRALQACASAALRNLPWPTPLGKDTAVETGQDLPSRHPVMALAAAAKVEAGGHTLALAAAAKVEAGGHTLALASAAKVGADAHSSARGSSVQRKRADRS